MRIVAFIEDPFVARKILDHLGLPARAPPRGRQAWRRREDRREELPVHEGPFVNTPDAADIDW